MGCKPVSINFQLVHCFSNLHPHQAWFPSGEEIVSEPDPSHEGSGSETSEENSRHAVQIMIKQFLSHPLPNKTLPQEDSQEVT